MSKTTRISKSVSSSNARVLKSRSIRSCIPLLSYFYPRFFFLYFKSSFSPSFFTVSVLHIMNTCPCRRFYANQKKILELNPRHPLVKELKQRIEVNKEEQTTKDLAMVLFETATLRSNFLVQDTAAFAGRIERMLRLSMDISLDEKVRL